MSILWNRKLEARNPFGVARNNAPTGRSQNVACFSEVPLFNLKKIAHRRSEYGIGFTKEFARSRGALPIWYVEKDSQQHKYIEALIARAKSSTDDPIWGLTPFIDIPGDYPTGVYRFEWEREWRCNSDFSFSESDVAFLIIPERLHKQARIFFDEAKRDNSGPAFDCPYIDSSWNEGQILTAFKNSLSK